MIKPKNNEVKCKKCGGISMKSGVMESGNSKYEHYTCKICGNKMMQCVGLMK